MVRKIMWLCVTVLISQALIAQSDVHNARIKIDTDRVIGDIHEHIYGNFAEHLGRCIYGGIYDPDFANTTEEGFRKDVLEAAKGLNVSLLRWPGGNFVSGYHWQDGIGPKDERPQRTDLAWRTPEPNTFGTDEFIEYCRALGTEPYFAVNLGTGTLDEARRWVEYCNIESGPYYAELRKKFGHEKPHNVKYWSLGNEMDGWWQMGHKNATDYGKFAREAAKLMKWTDPSIKLIAAGSSNFYEGASPHDWNETILDYLVEYVDYIALHLYVRNDDNNYYKFMASPLEIEKRTDIVRGQIGAALDKAGRDEPIYIAWDEYNVWYRARGGEDSRGRHALEEKYNLEDAVVIAQFLNAFLRNADIVKMANMAQLVNVIAPIFTNETDLYHQTIYYPLQLFANNAFGKSLDAYVDVATYDTEEFKDVPYLDVSVAYDEGQVVINVVNRHRDQAIETDIHSQTGQFAGMFEVYEVNGPDIKMRNTFDEEPIHTVQKPDIEVSGERFTYTFPPHSYTMIKGRIEQ